MLLIDCETDESALETTSAAFGIEPQKLLALLIDLRKIENGNSPWLDPGRECGLLRTIETTVRREARFDGVCYFHFSRVLPHEQFERGIIPGVDRIEDMWEMLRQLLPTGFRQADWEKVRRDIATHPNHWAYLYRLKTEKRGMAGPFGQLIHKVVFIPEWNGIHYLATPETIEDICIFFEGQHPFDLQRAFIDATKPCVVKFKVMGADRRALDDALHFVYRNVKQEGPHPMMLCHDAGGKVIPREHILRVKFLPDIYGPNRLALKAKRKELQVSGDAFAIPAKYPRSPFA